MPESPNRLLNNFIFAVVILVTGLTLGGCSSTGAPNGWLPTAEEAAWDPYGAWIKAELYGEDDRVLSGEFLAVGPDSLYVLVVGANMENVTTALPLDQVKTVKVASFDPKTGDLSGWVVVGSISTLSHGMLASVTLPLWVIGGSIMVSSHSQTPLESYPNWQWDELRQFSRFPQGPPPDIMGLDLVSRPDDFDFSGPPHAGESISP
jgi:hypothetical protein